MSTGTSTGLSTGIGSDRSVAQADTGQHHSHADAGWSWWYLLFLLQFIAVLWPPFYNRAEPAFIGIPFFYWYQLLWVILGAILTAIVHVATKE